MEEPAWEVGSRQRGAGSCSLPEDGLPWQGVSQRPSPELQPSLRALCAVHNAALCGRRSGTAGHTMRPFAKSPFVRMPFFNFFFFPQKGQREQVAHPKLIGFSTVDSYLFLHYNNRDNGLLLQG